MGAGLIAFAAGILLSAWLGVWQWALTGAVVMVVLGILPGVRTWRD